MLNFDLLKPDRSIDQFLIEILFGVKKKNGLKFKAENISRSQIVLTF